LIHFSVCIETLLTEYPFAEKCRKAAEIGIPTVEFWLHDLDEKDMKALQRTIKDCKVEIADIVVNSNVGDVGGRLVDARDESRYLKQLRKTIELAQRLDCRTMITCSGNTLKGVTMRQQTRNMVNTLNEACKVVERDGMTLLLEPLNTIVDHPGYFLDSTKVGFRVVSEVDSSNLKLLFDIYHMQIMEGNILQNIENKLHSIGHFHCAGVLGRHELDLGELDYRNILNRIAQLGYDGYVGLEYYPTVKSEESLKRILELQHTNH
jgi:hydroxypyruvate isomerase